VRNTGRYALIFFMLCPIGFIQAESGYYIEELMTTPPLFGLPEKTHLIRTWITADRLRRDEGNHQRTFIFHTKDNQAWLINHQDSTVAAVSKETFQGLTLVTMMMFGVTYDSLTGEPIIPDSIFYRTGRKSRVNNWACEEVIIQSRHTVAKQRGYKPVLMWVAKDSVIDQPIYMHILKSMMGPLGSQYTAFFNQLERLGGYPAELHTQALGMEIKQQLKIFKKQEVDDAVFNIPANYTTVSL
jgi:hypothetical protein